MSKQTPKPVRLPPELVRQLLRRRYVTPPATRALIRQKLAALDCERFGHKWENIGIEQVCRRCGERVI